MDAHIAAEGVASGVGYGPGWRRPPLPGPWCSVAGWPGPGASAAADPAGTARPALLIPPPFRPLSGEVIGVDPGHNGGNFTHAAQIGKRIWNGREWEACNTTGTATDGGYTEALFNFKVATDLRADLIADGARVVMTRTTNNGVGPCPEQAGGDHQRCARERGDRRPRRWRPGERRGFALLVPVADGPNDHVIGSSLAFARDVRSAMLAGTPMPVSNYDGVDAIQPRDHGSPPRPRSRCSMIFIEVGNMRNATDARLLTSPAFQREVASALTAAIVELPAKA